MNDWNINVGSLVTTVVSIASFIGAVVAIAKYLKKGISKVVRESVEPVEKEIKNLRTDINSVKFDNCKNYVVDFLSKVEEDRKITNDELERFYENYQLYTDMGGNSYVHNWVERLKAEGKLSHRPMV